MKSTRRGAWWRYLTAVLVLGALALATVYLVFPGWLLKAQFAVARHSAGLSRHAVDVAGDHIVYLDGGSGTPVVLLHGFGANKDVWITAARHLTPHYRVIVPDLAGFGESRAPAGASYDAWTQARRLHAFLTALGVGEHHIGGSSMGGLIATVYAALYPQDVRSLMIAAGAGVRSPRESELERRLRAGENPLLLRTDADLDRLMKMVFYRPPSIPAPVRRMMLNDAAARRATYAKVFDDMVRAGPGPLEPLLPRLTSPTLIVWGAHDQLLDVSAAGVFGAAIHGSETTIFPDCGHALPLECGEPLAQRYVTFLAALPDAREPD